MLTAIDQVPNPAENTPSRRTADDKVELLRSKVPDGLAGVIDLYHHAAGAALVAAVVRPGGAVASAQIGAF
jgi:hypothetical protein